MPLPVQVFIVGAFGCSVGFWRNDDTLACLLSRLDYSFIGIKRLIGNDHISGKTGKQDIGSVKVMRLSRREMKARGIT